MVKETIEFLKTAQPVGPLVLSSELSAAAQDHVNDTGPKAIIGHDGSDGSTAQSRIEKHCDWLNTMGENVDYGNTQADDIIMALCVDDGVPDRGHRVVSVETRSVTKDGSLINFVHRTCSTRLSIRSGLLQAHTLPSEPCVQCLSLVV